VWQERLTGSVEAGSTAVLNRDKIEFSGDRSFKLVSCTLDITASGPALMQIRSYAPLQQNSAVSQSGVFSIGVTPVRRTMRYAGGWFAQNTGDKTMLVAINMLCPSKEFSKVTGLYSLKLTVLLSPEMVPEACPKLLPTMSTEEFLRRQQEEEESGWRSLTVLSSPARYARSAAWPARSR